MKIDESTAHVCLGDNEVKPGDRVVAYKNMCSNSQSDKPSRSKVSAVCTKEKIGGGTVVSNLNQHYSEVKFDTGVPFEEGTIVEVEK